MNSQFTDVFSQAAETQIQLEKQNEENVREIKRKYLVLLNYFANRIDDVKKDSNIKENIKCILKYCHKYIDNVDQWKSTFCIDN